MAEDAIDTAKFLNFLASRPEPLCHRCGNRNLARIWVKTPHDADGVIPRLPSYPMIDENTVNTSKGRYLPVYRLTCRQCGLISDFNEYALREIIGAEDAEA